MTAPLVHCFLEYKSFTKYVQFLFAVLCNHIIPGRLWRRLAYLRPGMHRKYSLSIDQEEHPHMSPLLQGFILGALVNISLTDRLGYGKVSNPLNNIITS
jgi:hypothetical protein